MSDIKEMAEVFTSPPEINVRIFERYVEAILDRSDDPEMEALRKEWAIDVCIDFRLACNVVNDKGEVLFRVPPIKTPIAELFDKNITGLFEHIDKLNKVDPRLAMPMINEEVTSDLYRGVITVEDVDCWKYIISKYGKDQPAVPTGSNPIEEMSFTQGDDDDW